MNRNILDRVKGCLVGLACGDAVGTTVEFKPKGSFSPVTDMVGGGPFNLEKGQWTDDTSMALCLGYSLLDRKGFDPEDQMNRYCDWWKNGYLSSNGRCFDIGGTVRSALTRYLATGEAFSGSTDKYSSGNGSIMRLAPIPIFYQSISLDAINFAGESSRTTHGSMECVESCKLFCELILNAFTSTEKSEVFSGIDCQLGCEKVEAIASGRYMDFTYEDLTGSGYVIESLESALWCFHHADSFEEAVLLAANIGNDADTTAAVCGQIAGAFYGYSGIPDKWKNQIAMAEEIPQLALDLYESGRTVQDEYG